MAILAFSISVSACASTESAGRLVIVGGALSATQDDVFDAFLRSGKPRDELKVVIIPAASLRPAHYGSIFRDQLVARGLVANSIEVLPLAVRDDSGTESVDESKWAGNADDPDVLKAIAAADLVWFTGGDQSRITQVLGHAEEPTPAFAALQDLLARGGTIGGTSAGAAVMSRLMLVGGSSAGALRHGIAETDSVNQEAGALLLGTGFGYFEHGTIDQHFDAKARLGRLLLALASQPAAERQPGFGIDENTALVVDLREATATVAGSGSVIHVTLPPDSVEASGALEPPYRLTDVRLDLLSAGDRIGLREGSIDPAPDKATTHEQPYYDIPQPEASGVLSGFGTLNQLITRQLIDNQAATHATSWLLPKDSDFGYQLNFRQTEDSRGFWTYRNGQVDHYTVIDIRLDLLPVEFTITQKEGRTSP